MMTEEQRPTHFDEYSRLGSKTNNVGFFRYLIFRKSC